MKRFFQKKKIMVIGDLMIDEYILGEVVRISPEAPVPVLKVREKSKRAGGAGNVLLNLSSLGMDVIAVGRVGHDHEGLSLKEAFISEGMCVEGIFTDLSYQTPVKSRMIASGQQLLRVDYEWPTPLTCAMEDKVIEALSALLVGVEMVAFSDYAKGFLTTSFLKRSIALIQEREIPIIVDPKGVDFLRYKGVTFMKPNLSEAFHAAKLGMEASLDEVADRILKEIEVETLIITRAKEGITIFGKEGRLDFPAHIHEVKDVTGAGDTVLAVMTATLANGCDLSYAARCANVAAGLAIQRIGCARISLEELLSCLIELQI